MSTKLRHMPLKAKLLMAVYHFVTDIARRSNYTMNRRLVNIFNPRVPPSVKPIDGVSSFDVTVDSSRNLWFRLYIPTTPAADAATTTLPLIIYFHGGGFCFLSADTKPIDGLSRRLASQIPAVVASVNYRLAPEHRCPCQYEDGFDALKYIDTMSFGKFTANVDPAKCFLAGDSAGGNLAHHLVLKANEYNKFGRVKVRGLIALQPFFGGEERTESETRVSGSVFLKRTDWMWKAFLPEGSDRNHPLVNVFGPNGADISGMEYPPTLVCIGGLDPLQDWQKRYHQWLKQSGKVVQVVEYPNAVHGFYIIPEMPEASMLITEIRDFVKIQSALE